MGKPVWLFSKKILKPAKLVQSSSLASEAVIESITEISININLVPIRINIITTAP